MTAMLNPFNHDQTPLVPIGSAYSVTLGKMLDAGKAVNDSHTVLPYIRAGNIQDDGLRLADVKEMPFSDEEATRLDLRRGDLLVVEGGAVGTSVVLDRDMPGWSFQKTVNRVRATGGWSTRFLGYVLRHYRDAGVIDLLCNGSTIRHLTAEKLRALRIPSMCPSEQRVIADYLDRETARIDTLIEEQQRLIELQRERRNAVLCAAFSPGPSTDKTKVGRLLSARPSYGVLVPRYVDETEGVPFVRVGDILNLSEGRRLLAIESELSNEYSRTKLSGGEILLGVVGKMGQAAVAPRWLAGANVARAVAVLRCRDAAVAPLLCAWLGSNDFLHQAELATSGDSIQPTLGMKDLARFDINLPTHPRAAADLAAQTAKIDTLIVETERFIELADERRSALITAAVTGEIDVREAA
ncbi:restriction endonuclease subunit S domain-containing protein [Streptomyces sp. UC4497]